MGKYTITVGQNLYDVALHIYGSIEGITDLLISNPWLSLAATLRPGQELIYSDDYLIDADVAAYYRQRGISPANGERGVYFKESQYARRAELRLSDTATSAGIAFSGCGVMEIDWGDNTPLQRIDLGGEQSSITHFFDNKIAGQRIVRLYGDFKFRQVDFTALHPSAIYLLHTVYAEEVTIRDCEASLDFLPLFDGLQSLDLSNVKTSSLLPLVRCRDLMRLDLTGADMLRKTLDEWLIALVREHYGRRSCHVLLTEYPSGEYREPMRNEILDYIITSGMEAIWLLTHEPSWNEGGAWRFAIGERIFTYEQSD